MNLLDQLSARQLNEHLSMCQSKCYSAPASQIIDAELSAGRMDPRPGLVGSGRVTILPDFGGSGRFGSALRMFKLFADYFSVPESIRIFEYCIRIDWFSTIFNIL